MRSIKKYWHVFLLSLLTLGLGVATLLTSQRLKEQEAVAPPPPKAVAPACTLTFSIATASPTPTATPGATPTPTPPPVVAGCENKENVYCYMVSADRQDFTLWAQLENKKDPQSSQCTETHSNTKFNYCLKPAI